MYIFTIYYTIKTHWKGNNHACTHIYIDLKVTCVWQIMWQNVCAVCSSNDWSVISFHLVPWVYQGETVLSAQSGSWCRAAENLMLDCAQEHRETGRSVWPKFLQKMFGSKKETGVACLACAYGSVSLKANSCKVIIWKKITWILQDLLLHQGIIVDTNQVCT